VSSVLLQMWSCVCVMSMCVCVTHSKRLRAADGTSFGNEVYEISFDSEDKQHIALFGATYHFKLEGVVDCPEFVVYFPLLEKYVTPLTCDSMECYFIVVIVCCIVTCRSNLTSAMCSVIIGC